MKIQRKGEKCLNCGEPLLPEDNYCRVCGQLNDNPNVSFGTLLFDFLSNYFSLDSRFSRSVVPFLFRPGYLTNRFIEGKRVSFANPIRLYLIISVVYFFLLSLVATDVTETFSSAKDSMSSDDQAKLSQVMDSIEVAMIREAEIDSTSNDLIQISLDEDSTNNSNLINVWSQYKRLKKSGDYSTNEMVRELTKEEYSWWETVLIRQFIRIDNSDVTSITAYLIKNASIMMFVLLPIFALVLKVVYVRRRHFLYFHHLIHGIHLHTFAFFIFSLISLLNLVWGIDIQPLALLLFGIYIFFSFKRVYAQSYIKTISKLLALFFIYGSVFALALVIEVIISLLIF